MLPYYGAHAEVPAQPGLAMPLTPPLSAPLPAPPGIGHPAARTPQKRNHFGTLVRKSQPSGNVYHRSFPKRWLRDSRSGARCAASS